MHKCSNLSELLSQNLYRWRLIHWSTSDATWWQSLGLVQHAMVRQSQIPNCSRKYTDKQPGNVKKIHRGDGPQCQWLYNYQLPGGYMTLWEYETRYFLKFLNLSASLYVNNTDNDFHLITRQQHWQWQQLWREDARQPQSRTTARYCNSLPSFFRLRLISIRHRRFGLFIWLLKTI